VMRIFLPSRRFDITEELILALMLSPFSFGRALNYAGQDFERSAEFKLRLS
jgi:hypothetical protein